MIAAIERIALIVAGAILGGKLLSAVGLSWWLFALAGVIAAGAAIYQHYDK